MIEPTISLRGVEKTYGRGAAAHRALKGIDLDVHAGELVMISGPSGSGKTTLLSILGCVLDPSGGHVRLLGRDVAGADEHFRAWFRLTYIGFVFQTHNLLRSLSAVDNVALMLEMRGLARRRAREQARSLLASVGVTERADAKPADLSGGEAQRVAIVRAVAGAPPILLADEPTASLDGDNGQRVTELLRVLAKRSGHTVVVVTHDARIFPFADRVIRVDDGCLSERAS